MSLLRAVGAEIWHLFVDNGALAMGLVAWVVLVGAAAMLLPQLGALAGLALFLGCAAILLANLHRAARNRR